MNTYTALNADTQDLYRFRSIAALARRLGGRAARYFTAPDASQPRPSRLMTVSKSDGLVVARVYVPIESTTS